MRDDELDRELNRLFADDRLALPVAGDAERRIQEGVSRRRRRRGAALAVAGVLVSIGAILGGLAIVPGQVTDRAEPPPVNPTLSTGQRPTGTSTTTGNSAAPTRDTGTGTPAPGTTGRPAPGRPDEPANPPANERPTATRPTYEVTTALLGPDGIGPLQLGMTERQAVATGALGRPTSRGGRCASYPVNGPGVTARISSADGITAFVAGSGVRTPEGIRIGSPRSAVRRAYGEPNARTVMPGTSYPVPGNPGAVYRFSFDARDLVASITLRLSSGKC